MVRKLPTFKGYIVDARLGEFRRIKRGVPWNFISFFSKQRKKLLAEYRKRNGEFWG